MKGYNGLFKVLGLNENASIHDVKNAYRALVKKYHPDTGGFSIDAIRFARITEAYKKLVQICDSSSINKSADIYSLGSMLLNGDSPSLRAFAAKSLGNSGHKSAYAFLRKGLFDREEIVIKSVVLAIGKLKIKQSGAELLNLYKSGSASIRLAVLDTVSYIGSTKMFAKIIEEGLNDNDPSIRHRASRLMFEGKSYAEYSS